MQNGVTAATAAPQPGPTAPAGGPAAAAAMAANQQPQSVPQQNNTPPNVHVQQHGTIKFRGRTRTRIPLIQICNTSHFLILFSPHHLHTRSKEYGAGYQVELTTRRLRDFARCRWCEEGEGGWGCDWLRNGGGGGLIPPPPKNTPSTVGTGKSYIGRELETKVILGISPYV